MAAPAPSIAVHHLMPPQGGGGTPRRFAVDPSAEVQDRLGLRPGTAGRIGSGPVLPEADEPGRSSVKRFAFVTTIALAALWATGPARAATSPWTVVHTPAPSAQANYLTS